MANNNNGNNQQNRNSGDRNDGSMTVREAGQKGGQRVSELVQEGKQAEGRGGSSSSDRDSGRGRGGSNR